MIPPSRQNPHVRGIGPYSPWRPPDRRGGWRGWARLSGVLALVAVSGGSLWTARAYCLPSGDVLPGLRIDGAPVLAAGSAGVASSAEDVRALVEERARELEDRPVRLVARGAGSPVLELRARDFGFVVDVERTVTAALRAGKIGDVFSRAEAARRARRGDLDVPLFFALDEEVALAHLLSLKEREDVQPISARLDLASHATIPEKNGLYVDADRALELAFAAARARAAEIRVELPTVSFAPRISSSFLKSLEIGTVVAEYETYFSRAGHQAHRGKNIDNAARRLDGLVLSPGEMVSFNDVIGERSEENGFFKSWEIFKGEMVEGVGGGTCQVASTFHAAAFFAGFDVLERLPHSRPSAYIPMGLDSTVVYPGVDLKLRNPHPFPVVVHALTQGGKLRVELLGKTRPVQVSFHRELLETVPYSRKIVEEPALSAKKVRVKQHGIKGFRIKRERVVAYADGTRRKEEFKDFYPPTTEIYEVPVGFDVTLLPELPDATEDEDLGGNPSAPPPSARVPAAVGTTPLAEAGGLTFEEAPGAHAPTSSQVNPPKTMTLRR